jgi:hypothetical protein
MANIFEKTDQSIGGAFTAENCIMQMKGKGGKAIEGAIVQRVQFNIERPINLIYEIPTSAAANGVANQKVYYVGGRRRGQATFERIVGGSGTFKAFVDGYGPLCESASDNIILTAKGGCKIGAAPAGKGISYTLKTPRITALGGSVSAQDIVIVENVQMVFLDLEYTEV